MMRRGELSDSRVRDVDALDVAKLADPPWFVPESTSLLEQMQAFRKRRDHLALVVDEYGALQGVVTLEDIIEEIVGEMPNEPMLKGETLSVHPKKGLAGNDAGNAPSASDDPEETCAAVPLGKTT